MKSCRSRNAFTLAESLAASVILAVAVVGVSGALIASQQQSGVQRRSHVLTMFAEQLMEQVTALPMVKADGTTGVSGWPSVINSLSYDTLDDYAGYSDIVNGSVAYESKAAAGATASLHGTRPDAISSSAAARAGSDAVTRTVTITFPSSAFGVPNTVGDVAVVNVTVRVGTKESFTLSRTVCRWTSSRSG